ncbi:MAG: ABC-2 transporter permease [Candidatus Aminicenantaceae bacterium]
MYSIGALLMSEQYEEKNHGYAILSALPVSNLEITGAKFLLPLASSFALTLSLIFLFATFSASAQDMVLVRSYFLLAAGAGLLVAYLGLMLLALQIRAHRDA